MVSFVLIGVLAGELADRRGELIHTRLIAT